MSDDLTGTKWVDHRGNQRSIKGRCRTNPGCWMDERDGHILVEEIRLWTRAEDLVTIPRALIEDARRKLRGGYWTGARDAVRAILDAADGAS